MQKSELKGRDLIASINLVSLAESYGLQLKKDKGEYVGLCPFHADNNPSFFINAKKTPNLFCCTPCSMGGNALEFVIQAERARGHFYENETKERAAAYKILEAGVAGGELPRADFVPEKAQAEYTVLAPVPPNAPPPVFSHYQRGLPVKTWAYRNAAGEVMNYVARFELADGGKDVMPLSFVQRGEKQFWKWHGQNKPRPLYGLDKLAKAPAGMTVLLVEGEKTADAANSLLAGACVALTWPGGSNSVRFADWAPLAGRNVLVWPDNDTPGFKAMFGFQSERGEWKDGVAQFVMQAGAKDVRAVLPTDVPEGWDIADGATEGWDEAKALAYLKSHVAPVPTPERENFGTYALPTHTNKAPAPEPVPVKLTGPQADKVKPRAKKAKPAPEPEDEDGDEDENAPDPYRVLGFNKSTNGQNEFFIYSYKARQVLRFSPSNFTRAGLLQLADASYWEKNFITVKGQGYETNAAQYLMNTCYSAGVFDSDVVRGIGAWFDAGRTVVHAGTHIVEQGKEYTLEGYNSKYIYEANHPFDFNVVEPLSNKDAAEFSDSVKLLSWERPAYADLFLGWCVIAPVCGALPWRPHIWLTGPAGSGKTTAMGLMKNLLGNIALPFQGNTTEAAIRQSLNQDARPVCFDEADSDGATDNTRLQSILSLVRAASSHDGGGIGKGGANGNAQTFLIRACFAFASITPKVANAADRSRVSVLSLVKPAEILKSSTNEKWAEIENRLFNCFTPERCERMRARTLSLLPELLANAKVFARAAAVVLGEQRAGDQLGVLLAGAYSVKRRDVIQYEDAKKYIEARNWDEIRNEEKDEQMLLAKLMEQEVRVRNSGGVEHIRTIGELVLVAADGVAMEAAGLVGQDEAAGRLGRIGIRVKEGSLYISNTADWITKVLRGTAWATNHGKVLGRLPGAESVKNFYFGPGTKTRAVRIPIDILRG